MSAPLAHAAPPANTNEPARIIAAADSLWSHAALARAALSEGDAPGARHHLLRLILAAPPPDAPPRIAKLVERRRLAAVIELAARYLRLRGLES